MMSRRAAEEHGGFILSYILKSGAVVFLISPNILERGTHLFLLHSVIWKRGTRISRTCQLCSLFHRLFWEEEHICSFCIQQSKKEERASPELASCVPYFTDYFGKRNTFVPSAFSNLEKRNAHLPNLPVVFLISPNILERGTHLFLLHSAI
jgi:hypothetical protein